MTKSQRYIYFVGGLALILAFLFSVLAIAVHSSGAITSPVSSVDNSIARFLEPGPFAAKVLLFFTYLANPIIVVILEVFLVLYLLMIHRKTLAALMVGGLILGEGFSSIFKMLFARERPLSLMYELPRMGYAFPSGHAVISMVFYGFLGYCLFQFFKVTWQRVSTVLVTIIIIGLIGISRIALNFHWASDVLGGWILGGAILCLVIMLFTHLHNYVSEDKLKFPHGIKLVLILVLVIAVGFFLFGFYVTHPLKNRSRIESELRA